MLAVRQPVGDQGLADSHLANASELHRMAADAVSTHMQRLCANACTTPSLAAKLLTKDPWAAPNAATPLLERLDTDKPDNNTAEETMLCATELCCEFVGVSSAGPPMLMWHGNHNYSHLFEFLALRFRLVPVHVMDCERMHARCRWALRHTKSAISRQHHQWANQCSARPVT